MQQQKNKVIPFSGEFYPPLQIPEPPESPKQILPTAITIALTLVAGLAIGAISTYQSADFQRLQQFKTDSKQLSIIKKEICK